MDIKALLTAEHSKTQTQRIADYIGKNPRRFAQLMKIFLSDDARLCQRSSWVVNYCAEGHPDLIYPYIERMLAHLENPVHNAIKRNTIRSFQFIAIPEEHLGSVVEICFQYLADPKEAIAVRCFSMEVLYQACLREPDLSEELCLTIEDHLEFGSAGFKSRGKKVLRLLRC